MKNNQTFTEYCEHKGYAAETLLNGNFTHCVEYLRGLSNYGAIGAYRLHEEMQNIKETAPHKYEAVKNAYLNFKN